MHTTYSKLQELKNEKTPLLNKDLELKKVNDNMEITTRLAEILEEEKAIIPFDKLKIVLHTYVYTIVLLLMRGGKNFESIIGL